MSRTKRELISSIFGHLHVIDSRASMIERWKDDPNASVVRWAAEIQDHRRKAHEALAELSDAVKEQE